MPDRNEVLLSLLHEMNMVLTTFDSQGFAPFVDEWQRLHAWQGEPVRIVGADGETIAEGRVLGVDDAGVLLLETAEGIRLIHSGEVSLRPGGFA